MHISNILILYVPDHVIGNPTDRYTEYKEDVDREERE